MSRGELPAGRVTRLPRISLAGSRHVPIHSKTRQHQDVQRPIAVREETAPSHRAVLLLHIFLAGSRRSPDCAKKWPSGDVLILSAVPKYGVLAGTTAQLLYISLADG